MLDGKLVKADLKSREAILDLIYLIIAKEFGYSWSEVLELTPEELVKHMAFLEAYYEKTSDVLK